jgi:hypothetical protein
MRLGLVSFRDLRKRYFGSIGSWRWERRLRREIDSALSDKKDLLLPDFLIIGAPKCATSWLRAALAQHPQVRIVRDEIEYFSSHVDRPLQWYLSHFEELAGQGDAAELGEGEKLVMGEKSAGYCGISPARVKLVHRLLPDARLILMIRDPVSRHWSHAKRYFSKEKSQAKGYQSLDSRQKLYEFFTRTRRFSEFSKTIENWTSVYPPERLLVISQESAFADPVREFERALNHINASGGISRVKMKRVKRNNKNSGPVVPMPPDVKDFLEQMFAKERESLAGILKTYAAPEREQAGGRSA